jgi:pimeloyl-ACP methyl ester carboxylesterase
MTAWVLLRGLTREAGHWGALPAQLAARVDGPVLPLELPGNGARWREPSPWHVRAMAQDLLERLPPGPPPVLLAMSLGAMVALQCCHDAPDRIAGCVVINTSAGGLAPPWQRLRPRQWPRLAGLLRPGLSLERREHAVLAMTSADPAGHPDAPAQWAALARAHPVSAANAVRQLVAAARWRAPRQAPPVPVLLLAAAGDRLVAADCSRRLAAHWRVPLVEHPGAGHDLPLDDPQWLLEQALRWWAQVRGH